MFFDFIADAVEFGSNIIIGALDGVANVVGGALDGLSNLLGGQTYNKKSVSDHVDVDKELKQFRERINDKISELENKRINEIGGVFSELKNATKNRFPDLIEIINIKQNKASEELKGTMMQYVREHLSPNDEDFRALLEMPPGINKTSAMNREMDRIIKEAEIFFYKRLINYVAILQKEFEYRLKTRLDAQSNQLNEQINLIEELELQAKNGNIDKAAVESRSIPIMEAAECMRVLLETEK